METNKIDQHLKECGVKFLPWIGKDYEKGLSYDKEWKLILPNEQQNGKKILVLGEYHYIEDDVYDPYEDSWTLFTRKVIDDFLGNTIRQRWMNTFVKFERSIFGRIINREESRDVWNHMAFYNYVQIPVSHVKRIPSKNDYAISAIPFFETLLDISPDIIIAWGKSLYWNLPESQEQLMIKGNEGEKIKIDNHEVQTWVYHLEKSSKTVLLIPVANPSRSYLWEFWNQVIKKGIENA